MPKVSREAAKENHSKIEASAAKMFAERGVAQVSLVDVMNAVGMTHGGFYRHYKSKSDLAVAACRYSFTNVTSGFFSNVAAKAGQEPKLTVMARVYLSTAHRDNMCLGCPAAAYVADVWRESTDSPLKQEYTNGIKYVLSQIVAITPGETLEQREQKALGTLSTIVGALCLSCAVNDDPLSLQILDATRTMIEKMA